jgi:predicted DNA-binding protein (MmcQ/YjbR family)
MMTPDQFNEFCASLPATAYVMQWNGGHVWKVGGAKGKVFAVGWWDNGKNSGITFKASEIAYEVLRGQDGLRPAPYFASRGMKWIQHYAEPGLSVAELKGYLETSHYLASRNLTKKVRLDLNID